MKVLILSCNTGGGHNAAGRALKEELDRRGIENSMEDALRFGRSHTSALVSNGYINIASYTPHLFGGIYRLGGFVSRHVRRSPVYYANARYARRLDAYIRQQGFDAVLCPHLFPAEALTWAARNLGTSCKVYAVATDYTCIPFMEETDAEAFFVPHADLIPEYTQRGIAREKLIPTGIPASARFREHAGREEARRELGIDENARVALLMTGSMGFGDILPLPERLCAAGPDVQVLVLVGNNKELKEKLDARFGGSGRVRAVGFTDQVPLYMAASDVLLSKPGGLSSTEAAVFGIPLVHTDPIPGCETRNAAFFQERGMSLRAQGVEEIAQTAIGLLGNDLARQAMRQAQKNTINPYAARDIIDEVLRRG
ncbi:MAG: glycosyltransferase [Candidatus Spyradocola sp.]